MNDSTARSDRRTGVRVNLTLPPEVGRALSRVAEAAGTGRASFVREWLVGLTPQLVQMAEALEAARAGQVDGLRIISDSLRQSTNEANQAQLELGRLRRVLRSRK